ncbi:MAG TPA: hypothetical protein VN736_08065 [Candidatus Limnocylindrales bacterium]|nr:hypothetical protein [Candidatus Limnocylindrales bacterium]
MIRFISLGGMTGGFLMISPKLREQVAMGFNFTATTMNDYSPFSYIGAAIAVFAFLTIGLYRTSR